jgi:hypothetical protein
MSLLSYDQSETTAKKYKSIGRSSDWVEQVLSIGYGDCDVINGLFVLLLRKAAVPARLVGGVVGREGQSEPGWHAWVEILQAGRLKVEDASAVSTTGLAAGFPSGSSSRKRFRAGRSEESGDVASQAKLPSVLATRPVVSTPERSRSSLWVGVLILLLGLGSMAWILMRRLGRTAELNLVDHSAQRWDLLVGMSIDALRRPKAWKDVPGIWHRSFLPCLGGKMISLARMVRLCQSGKALLGSSDGELANIACQNGFLVLAADDPHFGQLYSQTANLRDLDELQRFKPDGNISVKQAQVVTLLSTFIKQCKLDVACCPVVVLHEPRVCIDMDLALFKPGKGSGWPQKYVALNLAHPWWEELVELFSARPGPALAVAVDRLVDESSLLKVRARRLRLRAAGQALEG